MTTLYTIHCGLDTNGHDVDADSLARQIAAECFPDGHTIIEAQGRYLMRTTGEVIDEPTLIVQWMATDAQKANGEAHAKVNEFAAAYKAFAHQESVMITTQEVYAVFV